MVLLRRTWKYFFMIFFMMLSLVTNELILVPRLNFFFFWKQELRLILYHATCQYLKELYEGLNIILGIKKFREKNWGQIFLLC